ncbi:MAG: hypothetical protein AB7F35_25805 [Acetobacteraceae bacterium]
MDTFLDTSMALALLPFPLAFFVHFRIFYINENASTPISLSFGCAVVAIAITLGFVALRVLNITVPYAALTVCVAETVLFAVGIYRLRWG